MEHWKTHIKQYGYQYVWATTATHQLGDLSRPEGDFARVFELSEGDYIGSWVSGLGFVNVHFPAKTTRHLTRIELEWLAEHPVVMA